MNKNVNAGKYGEKATFITNKLFLAIANSGGKLVSYGSKNIGGSRVLPRPIQPIVSPGSHKVGWIFNVPNISNIPIREIDKSCKTGFILRLQTHPIRFVWRFRIIAFILKLRSGRIRYRFLLWIVTLYLKYYDLFFVNQQKFEMILFSESAFCLAFAFPPFTLRSEITIGIGIQCRPRLLPALFQKNRAKYFWSQNGYSHYAKNII